MMKRAIRRWESPAEWLLVLAFTCVLAFHTVPRAWKTLETDFPNYYLTARLLRDHVDASRSYEWIWLQRQKDHYGIDQTLVGLTPITPFSTLAILPFAGRSALAAKHVWLFCQASILVGLLPLLRLVTGLSLRRVALLMVLSFPLHRNLLYGQYYLLLLLLLTGACWALQSRRPLLAGTLVGLAAACKVFPAIFCLYFVRRREWKALAATVLSLFGAVLLSIAAFGWPLHRTYLLQVLPWTLRGEALPPFNLASGSLSTLLHRLFVREMEWNPHPWIDNAALFAILHPLLQSLLLAPALLLVKPRLKAQHRIALEWSALLAATVVVSTSPASYLFVVLLLPAAVLLRDRYTLLIRAGALLLFVAIGYPG